MPVLVGGTGLYLRALTDPMEMPGTWPHLRTHLEARAEAEGAPALHAELAAIDPDAAAKMEPSNVRRIVRALENACRRGVRCHLFFGTSLDRTKHAAAMQELYLRLSAVRQTRGYLLVQRDPVESHAKFLVADDGHDGAVALMGSCNWLPSPFSAVEVSAELREPNAVAEGLDLLREIVSKLSSASRSVETLQFMASELRRQRNMLSSSEEAQAPAATPAQVPRQSASRRSPKSPCADRFAPPAGVAPQAGAA